MSDQSPADNKGISQGVRNVLGVRLAPGDPMQFLTFEDDTGLVETVFFPQVYRRYCQMLDWGRPYILAGRVDEDYGACTLNVDQVRPVRSS